MSSNTQVPNVQKALVIETPKAPFTLKSTPVPKPGRGEVLVKVMASALNPVDHFIQVADPFPNYQYPAILGIDLAGDVVDIGEGVVGFEIGDRVFFEGQSSKNDYNGFQQYALSPADTLGKIPSKLSYAQASTFPLTFATAVMPLLPAHEAGLNPTFDPKISFAGETAVVIGGGTSVGQFAIQIFRYLKYSTIITYASAKHTSYLKSLGATYVIDRAEVSLPDLPSALPKLTSQPIKMIYSAIITPEAQQAGYESLSRNCGAKIAIAHPVPQVPKEGEDAEGRIVYASYGSPHTEKNKEFGKLLWRKLPELIEEAVFMPNRVEDVPNGLLGIPDALKRLAGVAVGQVLDRGVSGVKLVAYPQETV